MRLIMAVALTSAVLFVVNVLAQQPATPCEEVRSILAQNAADLATQVRVVGRENEVLKAKLAELEKKQVDHKGSGEQKEEKKP